MILFSGSGGDMGMEIDIEKVGLVQKLCWHSAIQSGKERERERESTALPESPRTMGGPMGWGA